jgi:hypothetical protein
MSSGENSLPPQQKMVRRFFLSARSDCFCRPRATHIKRQGDMVCDGGRCNFLSWKFLLCNSEFLILFFPRVKVQLHVYGLKSFPIHFEEHIAGRTRLRHRRFSSLT